MEIEPAYRFPDTNSEEVARRFIAWNFAVRHVTATSETEPERFTLDDLLAAYRKAMDHLDETHNPYREKPETK